jgi:hypothetical protein
MHPAEVPKRRSRCIWLANLDVDDRIHFGEPDFRDPDGEDRVGEGDLDDGLEMVVHNAH